MVDFIKWIVAGTVGCFLVIRLNSYWFSLVMGSLLNALFVKVLKRLFKVPRPKTTKKVDPGMPSSHAHMLMYFTTYAFLSNQQDILTLGICLLTTLYVAIDRVRRGIHTPEQIIVGLFTGSFGAWSWYESTLYFKFIQIVDETESLHLRLIALGLIGLFGVGILGKIGRKISGKISF